jgi:hypothetical protein
MNPVPFTREQFFEVFRAYWMLQSATGGPGWLRA